MPAELKARPRDARGYPVPAITPWRDGEPLFADQSAMRLVICLARRLCSVCGTKIPPGPVWRVIDEDTAANVALALESGRPLYNTAPAVEGPGHRACMLYSAMVCPHLASPYARRSKPANAALTHVEKGDARGDGAAVVGYDGYSFQLSDQGVEIYFGQPISLETYGSGEQLRPALDAELSLPSIPTKPCPDFLLADEEAMRREFTRMINATPPKTRSTPTRANLRKAQRTARRKNR